MKLDLETRQYLIAQYGKKIDGLVRNSFGDQRTCLPVDKLNQAFDESNFAGLLVLGEQLIGFVLVYIPDTAIKQKHFLYLNKLIIAADYQGKHYGSPRTLVEAFNLCFPWLEIGFVGARTQSPGLLRSFISLSPVSYPFTKSYAGADEEGIKLLIYCFAMIPQLRNGYTPDAPFLASVGVFVGAYQRQLGIGLPERGNPVAEGLLLKVGFQRDRGDAVLVISQLWLDVACSTVSF